MRNIEKVSGKSLKARVCKKCVFSKVLNEKKIFCPFGKCIVKIKVKEG